MRQGRQNKVKESKPNSSHINVGRFDQRIPGVDSGDFKRLFQLYWPALCDYLRSRYGEGTFDPEDVAQAAFTKLAEVKDSEKIKNPQAFLFSVARNIAIDEFRKAKIRLAHEQDASQSTGKEIVDGFSPENVLLEREKLELMSAVIEKLSKMQRTILLLHRLDKLTYSQIASKYGLSETTVRRHVAGAVEKIHKGMKQANVSKR